MTNKRISHLKKGLIMGGNETQRTQLTNNRLKESTQILQDIIAVCDMCSAEDITWSQACREKNLDPKRTRRMILNLYKCTDSGIPLEDMEIENIYDGYEKFYQNLLGDKTFEHAALPFDYKESVAYIIKNADLTDTETLVIMRHFGIVDFCQKETFESIAKDLNVTRERVNNINAKALYKCRSKEHFDILRLGLSKYTLMQKQAQQMHDKELEQLNAQHQALIEKQDEKHEKRMQIIISKPYDEALIKILPDNIQNILGQTPISVLNLSVRPNNALRRDGRCTLFDVLKVADKSLLLKIRHMGKQSADEVMEKINNYINERYHMSVGRLRLICFPEKK